MPKQPTTPVADPAITGLQPAPSMPIVFHDRTFDLASLSADDRAYLAQFPEQVPYLPPVVSPAGTD